MTRRYESPLRQQRAEQTRERILAAFAVELGAGREDFSIPSVAARAGVSPRTVHHHFPTRDDQLSAVAAWIERAILGDEKGPADARDLPGYAERVLRAAVTHEDLARAFVAPGVAVRVRELRRGARMARIDDAVRGLNLPEPEGTRAAALLKAITSADFALALIDRYGLKGDDVVGAVRLAVEAILARAPGPVGR